MTTISQLVKAGKNTLIPALEEMNFKHFGKLIFAREVGDGIHQLIIAELSYGENLKFFVTCFVPEFDAKYMDKYPFKVPITSGGDLGEGLISGEFWEVKSLTAIEEIFSDIVNNIKMYALPWFESISSRRAYVDALYPYLKDKLQEQGKLNSVLTGMVGEK